MSTNELSQVVLCAEGGKNRVIPIRRREAWRDTFFTQTLRLDLWKWGNNGKLREHFRRKRTSSPEPRGRKGRSGEEKRSQNG